ncbi:Na(+)/H(+) antiporter subunit C [Ruicaihuangia caeni]|uniref:Na(+)/H(+) antiporter subunit C n=1 Tax=Ruicaihuangia caeni TaxID=3042517 RepID=UPI00338D9B68
MMPLVLVALMVVLYSAGIYLMLERSITRVLLGFLLAGNATNLLIFLMSDGFGAAPLLGDDGSAPAVMSDPLPQAFILTAIVITFGVSAFLMALIYRSWRLGKVDIVQDDLDDIEIAKQSSAIAETSIEEVDTSDTEFADDVQARALQEELGAVHRSLDADAAAMTDEIHGSDAAYPGSPSDATSDEAAADGATADHDDHRDEGPPDDSAEGDAR